MTLDNLFAYGTLMCEDIMRFVAGCFPANVPGILKGYRRRAVKGENYPALVPDENGRVKGVVYRDVPDSVWVRLDRFEGEMYRRKIVRVAQEDGTFLFAMTYVVQPSCLECLELFDWDFAEFLRNDKAIFYKSHKGLFSGE